MDVCPDVSRLDGFGFDGGGGVCGEEGHGSGEVGDGHFSADLPKVLEREDCLEAEVLLGVWIGSF